VFTGLVEGTGQIVAVEPVGKGHVLRIETSLPVAEFEIGESIAVDGVCLTVEETKGSVFSVIAGSETLALTTLDESTKGRDVHLERALQLGGRLGGHWVQGHVDGVGRVTAADRVGESLVLWFEIADHLMRYVTSKGSICIDGVSLTVNEISADSFRVNIVPHTQRVTRLGVAQPDDRVNIEVDILAKYLETLVSRGGIQ